LDDFDYEPFTKSLTDATPTTSTSPSPATSSGWTGVDASSLLKLINIALDFLDNDTSSSAASGTSPIDAASYDVLRHLHHLPCRLALQALNLLALHPQMNQYITTKVSSPSSSSSSSLLEQAITWTQQPQNTSELPLLVNFCVNLASLASFDYIVANTERVRAHLYSHLFSRAN
jgi:hypothetical protein